MQLDKRARRNLRAWLRPDGGTAVAILNAFDMFRWIRGSDGAVILHLGRVASRFGRRDGDVTRALDAFERLRKRGVIQATREGVIARILSVDLKGVSRHPAVEPIPGDRIGVDAEHLWWVVEVLASEGRVVVRSPDGEKKKLRSRTWRKRVRMAPVVYLSGAATPVDLHAGDAAVIQ